MPSIMYCNRRITAIQVIGIEFDDLPLTWEANTATTQRVLGSLHAAEKRHCRDKIASKPCESSDPLSISDWGAGNNDRLSANGDHWVLAHRIHILSDLET